MSLYDICFTIKAHGDYGRKHTLCYKHMGARCNLIKRLESVFCLSTPTEREEQREGKRRENCRRENAEKAQSACCFFGFEGQTVVFLGFLIKNAHNSSRYIHVRRVCGHAAPHYPSTEGGGAAAERERH